MLWAVRSYWNMVWGSRNAEKKKKETISVWRFIKMNKICKVKVDDEIEWNHSAKAIFTWKINRNNYVNQTEVFFSPQQQNDELIRQINFVMCFNKSRVVRVAFLDLFMIFQSSIVNSDVMISLWMHNCVPPFTWVNCFLEETIVHKWSKSF